MTQILTKKEPMQNIFKKKNMYFESDQFVFKIDVGTCRISMQNQSCFEF